MSDKNDGGDKTEQPTSKKLEDARKKGDVAKSREVTSAVGLVLWLVMAALATGFAAKRLAALFDALFGVIGAGWASTGFAGAARTIGALSAELALTLVAILVVPAALVGLLTDFLQTGPVLSFDKVTPKLENLNPVEGVKRMFSMDHLIEVIKALAKTVLLLVVGWLVVRSMLPQLVRLGRTPDLPAAAIGSLMHALTLQLMGWAVGLFVLVAILDAVYQRHAFLKKMRMSMRDIRQEMKESEGDPHIKAQRRQQAQEQAQRQQAQAARQASVLVVNPTHVAIAIDYDRESCPVPMVAAKGEEHVARAMRAAAEEAGVPIVRNVALARDLLARAEVGDVVPADLFDLIAEVILWAREVREQLDAQRAADHAAAWNLAAPDPAPPRRRAAPGLDLTAYPDRSAGPSRDT
ncbi:type III secretion system export apparatus subunit SctU [Aquincola sp. S2]|uniref:Type III secretion system export apparatus subunit SctU n=1 Tax=Pseudaquabacterium terrae TaxID=2732868 RepID=A0ABX2EF49_9BURK|nr:type III secretion system export apparatus subunit SctU [Aquabacterium terrae]NRF67244.1 type III secretion system export apparatus subunit SctU [Aquabacterium terrae]